MSTIPSRSADDFMHREHGGEDVHDDGESVCDLLTALVSEGKAAIATIPTDHEDASDTIMKTVVRYTKVVNDKIVGCTVAFSVHVVAGLALHMNRACDVGLRENVLMLHILAGWDLVRAHGGILYTYDDGAFHGYKGVVSEAVLSRCKSYLKRLEGMFSCLPSLYQVEKTKLPLLTFSLLHSPLQLLTTEGPLTMPAELYCTTGIKQPLATPPTV